jgi:hypothetical protein
MKIYFHWPIKLVVYLPVEYPQTWQIQTVFFFSHMPSNEVAELRTKEMYDGIVDPV